MSDSDVDETDGREEGAASAPGEGESVQRAGASAQQTELSPEQRQEMLSRRALIRAGWTIPAILAVTLFDPAQVQAISKHVDVHRNGHTNGNN